MKRCPIKSYLNKHFKRSEKIESLRLHLDYDRDTPEITTHYYRSVISWAIYEAFKKEIPLSKIDLIIILVLDEMYSRVYSEELLKEHKEILKLRPKTLQEYLPIMKPFYNKVGTELFDGYGQKGIQKLKDEILNVIYLVLSVHHPDYLKSKGIGCNAT